MKTREVIYLAEFAAMLIVWLGVGLTYQVMTQGRWRKSPEGRHVMTLAMIFVWLALLISANVILRDYPGRAVMGIISYGLPVPYGIWRWIMIVRAQRAKIRREREAEGDRL